MRAAHDLQLVKLQPEHATRVLLKQKEYAVRIDAFAMDYKMVEMVVLWSTIKIQ